MTTTSSGCASMPSRRITSQICSRSTRVALPGAVLQRHRCRWCATRSPIAAPTTSSGRPGDVRHAAGQRDDLGPQATANRARISEAVIAGGAGGVPVDVGVEAGARADRLAPGGAVDRGQAGGTGSLDAGEFSMTRLAWPMGVVRRTTGPTVAARAGIDEEAPRCPAPPCRWPPSTSTRCPRWCPARPAPSGSSTRSGASGRSTTRRRRSGPGWRGCSPSGAPAAGWPWSTTSRWGCCSTRPRRTCRAPPASPPRRSPRTPCC